MPFGMVKLSPDNQGMYGEVVMSIKLIRSWGFSIYIVGRWGAY